MANKKTKKAVPSPQPTRETRTPEVKKEVVKQQSPPFNLKVFLKTNPYVPGILLFLATLVISLLIYKDYGLSWDEPEQRGEGLLSYNYIFNNSDELFIKSTDHHGAGFELLLVIIEKWLNLADSQAIYQMRHLVTHIVFLISAFFGYVLIFRLHKNKLTACLGFIMLVFAPRIYAHSFFNSKDMPFLCMFLITLTVSHIAFDKNKKWLFLILGLLCGYTTSIRILGVMLAVFIILFLLIDFFTAYMNKEKPAKVMINVLLFSLGFCFAEYIAWPYLWRDPINNFTESFTSLSHFNGFRGIILVNGSYVSCMNVPWTYFPTWFLITNPVLWLVAGFAGIVWLLIDFLKKPLSFLRNTNERNYLLYALCFISPILAVIVLHSVIYDDWRHLYFIYPAFVLLALYFINKLIQTRYKWVIISACAVQVGLIGFFMITSHPFQQVYFNELVSHDKEYLRKNYEMEYWGVGFKQGLDYLEKTNPTGIITVYSNVLDPLVNNIAMLNPGDRDRIKYTDRDKAQYFITNFRSHPYDYPLSQTAYSIKVLNSTILSVYKQDTDSSRYKQNLTNEITTLNKTLTVSPSDHFALSELGEAWFWYGRYDSAFTYYQRALASKPFCLSLIDLGGEYFGKRKYPEAVAFCKEAIEQTPKETNAYVNMSACYINMGKPDTAIYYLQYAAHLDPNLSAPFEGIASLYKKLGKLDSAKKYEGIAQKINPDFKL